MRKLGIMLVVAAVPAIAFAQAPDLSKLQALQALHQAAVAACPSVNGVTSDKSAITYEPNTSDSCKKAAEKAVHDFDVDKFMAEWRANHHH